MAQKHPRFGRAILGRTNRVGAGLPKGALVGSAKVQAVLLCIAAGCGLAATTLASQLEVSANALASQLEHCFLGSCPESVSVEAGSEWKVELASRVPEQGPHGQGQPLGIDVSDLAIPDAAEGAPEVFAYAAGLDESVTPAGVVVGAAAGSLAEKPDQKPDGGRGRPRPSRRSTWNRVPRRVPSSPTVSAVPGSVAGALGRASVFGWLYHEFATFASNVEEEEQYQLDNGLEVVLNRFDLSRGKLELELKVPCSAVDPCGPLDTYLQGGTHRTEWLTPSPTNPDVYLGSSGIVAVRFGRQWEVLWPQSVPRLSDPFVYRVPSGVHLDSLPSDIAKKIREAPSIVWDPELYKGWPPPRRALRHGEQYVEYNGVIYIRNVHTGLLRVAYVPGAGAASTDPNATRMSGGEGGPTDGSGNGESDDDGDGEGDDDIAGRMRRYPEAVEQLKSMGIQATELDIPGQLEHELRARAVGEEGVRLFRRTFHQRGIRMLQLRSGMLGGERTTTSDFERRDASQDRVLASAELDELVARAERLGFTVVVDATAANEESGFIDLDMRVVGLHPDMHTDRFLYWLRRAEHAAAQVLVDVTQILPDVPPEDFLRVAHLELLPDVVAALEGRVPIEQVSGARGGALLYLLTGPDGNVIPERLELARDLDNRFSGFEDDIEFMVAGIVGPGDLFGAIARGEMNNSVVSGVEEAFPDLFALAERLRATGDLELFVALSPYITPDDAPNLRPLILPAESLSPRARAAIEATHPHLLSFSDALRNPPYDGGARASRSADAALAQLAYINDRLATVPEAQRRSWRVRKLALAQEVFAEFRTRIQGSIDKDDAKKTSSGPGGLLGALLGAAEEQMGESLRRREEKVTAINSWFAIPDPDVQLARANEITDLLGLPRF